MRVRMARRGGPQIGPLPAEQGRGVISLARRGKHFFRLSIFRSGSRHGSICTFRFLSRLPPCFAVAARILPCLESLNPIGFLWRTVFRRLSWNNYLMGFGSRMSEVQILSPRPYQACPCRSPCDEGGRITPQVIHTSVAQSDRESAF